MEEPPIPTDAFDDALSAERTAELRARRLASEPHPFGDLLSARFGAIAGALNRMHAAGGVSLRESDFVLAAALAVGPELQAANAWLRAEHASGLGDWWRSPGGHPVGAFDLAFGHYADGGDGTPVTPTAALEAKWATGNTLGEIVWDVLKLGLAVSVGKLDAGFLLIGTTAKQRGRDGSPSDLLEGGVWTARRLLDTHRAHWEWCLKGGASRPIAGLPAAVATRLIAGPTPCAGGELVLVQVAGAGMSPTDESGEQLLPLPAK